MAGISQNKNAPISQPAVKRTEPIENKKSTQQSDKPLIASGYLKTSGTGKSEKIYLDENGTLKTGEQPGSQKPIGRLDPNGRYRLNDGRQGDVFDARRDDFYFNPEKRLIEGELGIQLREAQKARALQGDMATWIRNQIPPELDGKGLKVVVIEKNAGQSEHSKAVASVLKRYAPGVSVDFQPMDTMVNLAEDRPSGAKYGEPIKVNIPDDPDVLRDILFRRTAHQFNSASDAVEAVLAKKDNTIRGLNFSTGGNAGTMYQQLGKILEMKDPQGQYQFPHLRQEVYIDGNFRSEIERMQAVVNYVDRQMLQNPANGDVQKRWEAVAENAVRQGKFITVSAGNVGDALPEGVKTRPGVEVNQLAVSPYVLTAGASDTNQSPGLLEDDYAARFSSRNFGGFSQNFVLLPGSNVPVDVTKRNPDGVGSGTSFSAPTLNALLMLRLQQKPDQTFEEINQALRSSVVKPKEYNPDEMGLGLVHPIRLAIIPEG